LPRPLKSRRSGDNRAIRARAVGFRPPPPMGDDMLLCAAGSRLLQIRPNAQHRCSEGLQTKQAAGHALPSPQMRCENTSRQIPESTDLHGAPTSFVHWLSLDGRNSRRGSPFGLSAAVPLGTLDGSVGLSTLKESNFRILEAWCVRISATTADGPLFPLLFCAGASSQPALPAAQRALLRGIYAQNARKCRILHDNACRNAVIRTVPMKLPPPPVLPPLANRGAPEPFRELRCGSSA